MASFYDNLRASRSGAQAPANNSVTRGSIQKERSAANPPKVRFTDVLTTLIPLPGSNATRSKQSTNQTNTGQIVWDEDKISEILRSRDAGYDSSEQPEISMDVEVPKTFNVMRIQNGQLN